MSHNAPAPKTSFVKIRTAAPANLIVDHMGEDELDATTTNAGLVHPDSVQPIVQAQGAPAVAGSPSLIVDHSMGEDEQGIPAAAQPGAPVLTGGFAGTLNPEARRLLADRKSQDIRVRKTVKRVNNGTWTSLARRHGAVLEADGQYRMPELWMSRYLTHKAARANAHRIKTAHIAAANVDGSAVGAPGWVHPDSVTNYRKVDAPTTNAGWVHPDSVQPIVQAQGAPAVAGRPNLGGDRQFSKGFGNKTSASMVAVANELMD